MISVSQLKLVLGDEPNREYATEDFLRIHRFAEGYFKRVTFIALRLHGIQYKTAIELANFSYIGGIYSQLKKIFELLPGEHNLESIGKKYPDYLVLQELFLKYTASLRNRLLHGGIGKIKDDDVLKTAALIDKRFIQEFERVLQAEWNASAYDRPQAWGAKRILEQQDKFAIIKKFKIGKLKTVDWRLEDVLQHLNKHNIEL